MGEILEFRPKEATLSRTEKPMTPAEIFIFPGVRIERKGFSLADRLYMPEKRARKSCRSRQKSKE